MGTIGKKASFLTDDEKRAAVGYGPEPQANKLFNPGQLRAPTGQPGGGQWGNGDGEGPAPADGSDSGGDGGDFSDPGDDTSSPADDVAPKTPTIGGDNTDKPQQIQDKIPELSAEEFKYKYAGPMDLTIQWKLSEPSPNGGYIVQKIDSTTIDPNGTRESATYWEAWPVEKGRTTTDMNGGEKINLNEQPNDRFDASPVLRTTVDASARYYDGLELPSSFVRGSVKEAGGLPATYDDPRLPTDRASALLVRPTWRNYR